MKYLYIFLAFAGLSACQSNSKSSTAGLKATYDLALKAQDRETVISTLTQWVAQDSSVDAGVLDTLVLLSLFLQGNSGHGAQFKNAYVLHRNGVEEKPE